MFDLYFFVLLYIKSLTQHDPICHVLMPGMFLPVSVASP